MPPLKPDAAVINGQVAIFIGGAYAFLTAKQTGIFLPKVQSAYAQLLRENKREERARRKAREA